MKDWKVFVVVVMYVVIAITSFCYGNGKGYEQGLKVQEEQLIRYIERVNFLQATQVEWYPNKTFTEARKRFGSLHETPWDYFSIEEKMYLCAYGSSGNKLNGDDMAEIQETYGVNP